MIDTSKVFWRILNAFERGRKIVVLEGSARSTKTYSTIQYIIGYCLAHPGKRVTICRAKHTWLKATLLVDFLEILDRQFNRFDPSAYNKTESVYMLNNCAVSFIGLDEPQKVHGRKQDLFWINEAVEARYKDYEQLSIRTTGQIILDYNPSCTEHWIYDRVIPRDDCKFIHSTYKDNPFLEATIVREIERLKDVDEVSWQIYGLGLRAAHKGLIYQGARTCREFPSNAKRQCYGLDFGFANDPTAVVRVGTLHGMLFVEQCVYERGLVNVRNPARPEIVSIEQRLEEAGISRSDEIYADSAEPKSIAELCNAGWNVYSVDKGADSILAGIDLIKQYQLNIAEGSKDILAEKNMYKWLEDKDGRMLNKPIDAYNHALDAMRYAAWMKLRDTGPNII